MSSSNRRQILALLAAAPLTACGFTPVYAPGGAGGRLRGQIEAAAPDTRFEYLFVARFEERLGRAGSPRYQLDYQIETSETGLAITGTNDITRINIAGSIRFTVTDTATGAQVFSDSVSSFSAYSTTSTPVATAAAERDAQDRLMSNLADRVVTQLLASAGRWS